MLHDPLAIDAPERFRFHVEYLHFGRHRLMVGDALRVGAFSHADDLLGELHELFLNDLVVADDVEGDIRSNDSKAVDYLIGKKLVGDFDDAFLAEGFAVEVVADGDGPFIIVEIQQLNHFESDFGGNMVDDGSVLDGGNF